MYCNLKTENKTIGNSEKAAGKLELINFKWENFVVKIQKNRNFLGNEIKVNIFFNFAYKQITFFQELIIFNYVVTFNYFACNFIR